MGQKISLLLASLLFSFYAFLLVSQKIILAAADLGRYLKSGQLFFQSGLIARTNLYSYTNPNFPIINHHWAAGPLFYAVYRLGAFSGLAVFSAFLIAAAAFISFKLARQLTLGNLSISIIAGLLALPLITYRQEVRPENLSFLFTALDIYLLDRFLRQKLKFYRLAAIYLAIQLFWVNFHIFFAFGIALAGLAAIAAFINGHQQKPLVFLAAAATAISLANPFFSQGLLEPLNIFRNYGYMIIENQSIFFALKRLPNYIFIHTLALAGLAIIAAAVLLRRRQSRQTWFLGFVLFFFTALSLRYIRAIPLMGLSFMPFFSLFLAKISRNWRISQETWATAAAILIGLIFWFGLALPRSPYSPWQQNRFGWGLARQANAAGQFFRRHRLQGPIFNNYDIGGYLIWHLYPQERVFVDNRPEAYPARFFQKTYIPAQENERNWRKLDQRYRFNIIFFYRRDATPWAQPFLIRRLHDPNWVPIYVDNYAIIFIRDRSGNRPIIDKYRLPAQIFRISH